MSTATSKDNGDPSDIGNNDSNGQLASQQALQSILSTFPQDHIEYSFGYGSGVFSQTLTSDSQTHEGILDVIFVVNDTYRFHQANMTIHPHHYAPWLRLGSMYGPRLATTVQRHSPWRDGRVLFHVVDDPVPMKYGVIHCDDLINDLTRWNSLYVAGRMQKPTLPINGRAGMGPTPSSPQLDGILWQSQERNVRAALAAALLLSVPVVTEDSVGGGMGPSSIPITTAKTIPWSALYRQIAGLSYTGDFRMQVGGEDPHKLHKLVSAPGQLSRFQSMYQPILKTFDGRGVVSVSTNLSATNPNTTSDNNPPRSEDGGGLTWDPNDPSTLSFLQKQLPNSIQQQMVVVPSPNSDRSDTTIADIIRQNHDILAKALVAIVGPAARHQSMKGTFTLGLQRSIRYASAKLSKGVFRKKK
jgi:translocator assembly and maintenance protein 41